MSNITCTLVSSHCVNDYSSTRGWRSAVARSRQIVYLNTLNEVHVYTKFLEIFCEPIYLIGNCTQLKAVLLVNGFKKLFLFPFNATT